MEAVTVVRRSLASEDRWSMRRERSRALVPPMSMVVWILTVLVTVTYD